MRERPVVDALETRQFMTKSVVPTTRPGYRLLSALRLADGKGRLFSLQAVAKEFVLGRGDFFVSKAPWASRFRYMVGAKLAQRPGMEQNRQPEARI